MESQSLPGRDAIENIIDRLLTKVLGHPIPILKQRLKPPLTQLSHDLLLFNQRFEENHGGQDVERAFGMLMEGLREGLGILDDILSARSSEYSESGDRLVGSDDEVGLISQMILHYGSLIRWLGTSITQNVSKETADLSKSYLSAIRDRFFGGIPLRNLLTNDELEDDSGTLVSPTPTVESFQFSHFLQRMFQTQESRDMGLIDRIGQAEVWRLSRAIFWLDNVDLSMRQLQNPADGPMDDATEVLLGLMKSTYLILKVRDYDSPALSTLVGLVSQVRIPNTLC
jgi:hypothetical protein